jgi:glycosyltransferase involved in cell wall biosynthesis
MVPEAPWDWSGGSNMNNETRPAPEPAAIDPDYSLWRVVRFRLRQTRVWWLHTVFKVPLSQTLFIASLVMKALGLRKAGLKYLLLGRRVAPSSRADAAIWRIVEHDQQGRSEFEGLLVEAVKKPIHTDRILILKVPRIEGSEVVEKGALIVKFTETFAPLFNELDVRHLANYFRIILEPSWVGYSVPELLVWTQLRPEKVIVLAPYKSDFDSLLAGQSNLLPVTLGPADWVNPTRFAKLEGAEKVYDSIYVANFNPVKRVDRYLRAVVRVSQRRPEFRAALVCAGLGKETRYGHDILATIAWAKRYANVDFFHSVDQRQLNALLNGAKVNVLVSLREGANKCLAEGLFAGTPALLIDECACGNHRHITFETGRSTPDRELEKMLIWFADHHAEFRPNVWAATNISPVASIHRLSQILRELEVAEGSAWTTELKPKMNQPELGYVDAGDDWLLSRREELLAAFAHNTSVKVDDFIRALAKSS